MKARDAAYDADRQRLLDRRTRTGNSCASAASSRVACPARGTPFASGRLDRWLSVLDYVATAPPAAVFSDSLDFLLAVVRERTDPRTLPGVEAMMPGSALTRLLNATPGWRHQRRPVGHRQRDIEAGDSLGTRSGAGHRLVLQEQHDLVVDTASMLGGLPRRLGGAAHIARNQGPKVNHFHFTNDQSVRWLGAGQSAYRRRQRRFRPRPKPARRPAPPQPIARNRGGNKPPPIAVVCFASTMGNELVAGDDRLAQLLGATPGQA